jgi:hypothetical protein
MYFRLHIYDYKGGNIARKISPAQGLYGVYDKYYSKVSGGLSDYVTSGNKLKLDYQGKPTLAYDGFKILITSFKGKRKHQKAKSPKFNGFVFCCTLYFKSM